MRMQRTRRLVALALLLAGVVLLPPIPAQETKPQGKAEALDAKAAEQELKVQEALRNEVASFGPMVAVAKKYKVAEALADAGGILLKLSFTGIDPIAVEPVVELPKETAKKMVKPIGLAAQAEDLFDEARGCAKDSNAIENYIRSIKTAANEGFATRGVKKLEKKIAKEEQKIGKELKKLFKEEKKLGKDLSKVKHRDVGGNNPLQHLGALQQGEKQTLSFAPDGKPINVCFQSSAPVLVEVVANKDNAVVWSYHGVSGQYHYAMGPDFSVKISAPAGDTTYLLLIN